MKNEEILEVLEKVRSVKFKDNVITPINILEIPEIKEFGSFNVIMLEHKKGSLLFNFPNHLIHDIYSLISSKKNKRLNNITFQIPFLFALSMVIYGLATGDYWLLTLIPIFLISQISSSVLSGNFLYGILGLFILYFFYNMNYTIGIIFTTILISIYFSHQVRNQRRSFLIKLSEVNEELFCFLFFAKAFTITNILDNKHLYSGMNKIT